MSNQSDLNCNSSNPLSLVEAVDGRYQQTTEVLSSLRNTDDVYIHRNQVNAT